MRYKNLIVLGTSHIARQSIVQVEKYIRKEKPSVVALELDSRRLPVLMSKKKMNISLKAIKYIGLKGYIFARLGEYAERKLGNIVGVAPGSEMKKAVEVAREVGIEIALVDQDIETTLRRFSKALTWKEKRRFIKDILMALLGKKTAIKFDLGSVPSGKIIKKMTEEVKDKYPNVYKVLIEERNQVIAKNLVNLMRQNIKGKVLAVLGAGHVDEVIELVRASEDDIVYSFTAEDQYS